MSPDSCSFVLDKSECAFITFNGASELLQYNNQSNKLLEDSCSIVSNKSEHAFSATLLTFNF